MKLMVDSDCGGEYAFRPFDVQATQLNFHFSQEEARQGCEVVKGSNISAVWTPYFEETLINGVLQGRRQNDLKGASRISRRSMLDLFQKIVGVALRSPGEPSVRLSYIQSRVDAGSEARRHMKAKATDSALKGWYPNAVDDFRLKANPD